VAPTLLIRRFGYANPPSDYASGHDLFADRQWDWPIEPEQMAVVFFRSYEIRDETYHLVRHPTFAHEHLRSALREMSRFYR
jgi:membrane-anchored protein YejM (alkaline phosphatase superfamily)